MNTVYNNEDLARDRANAWKALLEMRARALRPKDKEVTELDRKVMMDALCSEQEREFMYLNSLYYLRMGGTAGPETSHEGTD